MPMPDLNAHVQKAEEAVRSLLSMLLGEDPSLQAAAPAELSPEAVHDAAEGRLVLHSPAPSFAVVLDPAWTSLLAEAMLGAPMSADDEGAADLLQEVAAQAYGAVQTALAEAGAKLPAATFTCHLDSEAAPLPEQPTWAVPFSAQSGALEGTVLLPALAPRTTGEAASQQPPSGQTASKQNAPKQAASSSGGPSVAPAAFADLGAENIGGDGGGPGNLSLLAEVELEVTAELGRRRLPLADMLRLTTGSVIELEKLVGEPLSIFANGHLIAEGEAVVIDEQFGIRITNLASKNQRERAFF